MRIYTRLSLEREIHINSKSGACDGFKDVYRSHPFGVFSVST
jgi:hypothetical protein